MTHQPDSLDEIEEAFRQRMIDSQREMVAAIKADIARQAANRNSKRWLENEWDNERKVFVDPRYSKKVTK